jgi:subtilisin family serine protease
MSRIHSMSPVTLAARLAALALSVSAMPLVAHAAAPTPKADGQWVYGVAAREAEDAAAAKENFVDYGGLGVAQTGGVNIFVASATGAGVVVAIVDTGIDLDHPEFTGRIAAGGTCFGDPTTTCAGAAAFGADDNGHGTHVAGIVAAANDGVGKTGIAPGASLLPVKVLDASGSGAYSDVASGIVYAAANGAKVINMSLGGPSPSSMLLSALQQAAPTSVIVAAAGNSGNRTPPLYPAAYATALGVVGSMIIVGSVDANNHISSFSDTPGNGGCVNSRTARTCYKDVFLVAPGRNIFSTYPEESYATLSGTSMATPYVAGVAALVLSAAPYLTPKQVVSILLNSAIDLGTRGTDTVYGRGLVNPAGALAPLGGASIATSGATTSSYVSSGALGISSLSGSLSYGVEHAQIAKQTVFFDGYGRDYHADITKSVSSGSVSLAGVVSSIGRPMRNVTAFADGYAVSGFVSEDGQNAIETAGFATTVQEPQLSDVVVTARFGEDTTMSVGHNATFAGHFDQLGLAASQAYDGLFMSANALNSPYLALTSDANFAAGAVDLGDGVTFSVGHAEQQGDGLAAYSDGVLSLEELIGLSQSDGSHTRSASNTATAVSWRIAPWAMVGVNAGYTDEQNSVLGGTEAGALALVGDAQTASFGLAVRVNLGDDWIASASWSEGSTAATPTSGSLFQSLSQIESEAYGVALSKLGILGDTDSLGLSVSRPLHITSGSAVMTLSTGVTDSRAIIYSSERVDLASATPETDYELGYTTRLADALTLQANALYQQDVSGDAGQNGVAAFATLKANW